jgi:hypothetical protein
MCLQVTHISRLHRFRHEPPITQGVALGYYYFALPLALKPESFQFM